MQRTGGTCECGTRPQVIRRQGSALGIRGEGSRSPTSPRETGFVHSSVGTALRARGPLTGPLTGVQTGSWGNSAGPGWPHPTTERGGQSQEAVPPGPGNFTSYP